MPYWSTYNLNHKGKAGEGKLMSMHPVTSGRCISPGDFICRWEYIFIPALAALIGRAISFFLNQATLHSSTSPAIAPLHLILGQILSAFCRDGNFEILKSSS